MKEMEAANYISHNIYLLNSPWNKFNIELQLTPFKIYFLIYAVLFKDSQLGICI